MPDIPDQPPEWAPLPLLQTTDRVLGGMSGPANSQARALCARLTLLRALIEALQTAVAAANAAATAAQTAAGTAVSTAATAATTASTASSTATTAQAAATAAGSAASAAQTTANTGVTNAATANSAATAANSAATAAQTSANSANTAAATAQTTANTALANAATAQALAATKALKVDLGAVSLAFTAGIVLVAGARSIQAVCAGALIGDLIIAVPTGTITDGYGVGAAQCLTAGTVRVSVSYPGLALGASFTIPVRVFAIR